MTKTQAKLSKYFPVKKPKDQFQTSCKPPQKKPKNTTTGPKKLTQTYLDCGQKSLKTVTCPICGMVYFAGEENDEKLHTKFHKEFISLPKWTCSDKSGVKHLGFIRSKKDCLLGIVQIQSWILDKRIVKKYNQVKDKIDSFLSYHRESSGLTTRGDTESTKESSLNLPSTFFKSPSKEHEQMFLLLHNQDIIGCVIATNVSEGVLSDGTTYLCKQKFKAKIGISRIWIHPDWRKRTLATTMVNQVRLHFSENGPIKKCHVAFSSPSEDGVKFISKYVSRDTFLVYRII